VHRVLDGDDPEKEDFLRCVVGEVSSLSAADVLVIAEFAPEEAAFWEVRLDLVGTPHVVRWPVPWAGLADGGMLSRGRLIEYIRPQEHARLILAQVSPPLDAGPPSGRAPAAFRLAAELCPEAPVFHLAEPVDGLIRAAVSEVPLTQWYELAALREGPGGKLIRTVQALFPPESVRGDASPFTIRVEAAEDPRTVFAVLAREDDADPPDYRIVSLESAPLPPGQYRVNARLLRPGRVRFEGLPDPLSADARTWSQVLAAIPERVPVAAPAHLVIAVELCGPQLRYAQRMDCATRLVQDIAEGARAPVRYSLIGYGSHSFVRMTHEDPIEELCWADHASMALGALARLGNRKALAGGSAFGAKLECALDHIDRRLAATEGLDNEQSVLVAIGTRPPFPCVQDMSRALPCPHGLDWRKTVSKMEHSGMAFGAVYDGDPVAEVWERLGSHARGRPSGFFAREFAMTLALLSPALPAIPLPLIRGKGR
jgi:hypothetical protein